MLSIFTQIINGDIPAHKVYEDELCFAFLDIHPINPGHTLLVPKKEVDSLWSLDDATYDHLWRTARMLAGRINDVLNPLRVGSVVEGFGVPHAHIHLIPLSAVEDIKKLQDMDAEPDHAALAEMAQKLAV